MSDECRTLRRRGHPGGPKYLFHASFDSTPNRSAPLSSPLVCDKGSLTVTDTENKLSISGGQLVCAGGKATPAWGDPGVYDTAMARVAGRALLGRLTITDATALCEFGFDNNQAGAVGAQGLRCNADVLYATIGGTVNPALYVPLDGTAYDLGVVLLSTGSLLLLKLSTANVWTVLYHSATGTTTPVYAAVPNNNAAWNLDNLRVIDLGGAWGSDYGITRAYVPTPAAITPTLGGEIHTQSNAAADPNGSEADATTGWVGAGGATIASVEVGVTAPYAGSSSLEGTATGSLDRIEYDFTAIVGTFYNTAIWAKRGAQGTTQFFGVWVNLIPPGSWSIGSETWTEYVFIPRASGTAAKIRIYATDDGGISGDIVCVDNVSIKPITLSTTLGTVYDKANEGLWEVILPTNPNGTQAGLVICLDDETNPQNGIFVYSDGTNILLSKLVSGTWTDLISIAGAWGATKRLMIRKLANAVRVWYGDVLIGTEQTISDASVTDNTKFACFSTHAANTFASLVMWPAHPTLPQGV